MKTRLAGLVGPDLARRVTVMPLHAFCSMVLRRYGRDRNYTIFDPSDSRKVRAQISN